MPLAPCPGCSRHVRTTETACPFCDGDLRQAFSAWAPPRLPTERLSRAALAAFAASSFSAAACSTKTTENAAPSAAPVAAPAVPAPNSPPIASSEPAPTPAAPASASSTPVQKSATDAERRKVLAMLNALPSATTSVPPGIPLGPGMAAYGGPPPGQSGITLGTPGAAYGAPPPSVGPVGKVTVGALGGSGATDVPNAERVFAGMRAGFRNCYRHALNNDPSIHGTARLSVIVTAAGAVKSASLSPTTSPSADVASCVVARARAAQFDPTASGGEATIVTSVQFAPE
ncbi:MAG TPA: AgmX/PglI C-terminal domain-containing protein [Polyangiaceae bacterium]|nr:AgmX/PglI C-terminal domain-containing protein [Polyangiaceae bacterium]